MAACCVVWVSAFAEPTGIESRTDEELTELTARWGELSAAERRAVLHEVRARMQSPNTPKRRSTNEPLKSASPITGTIVQRRYGRKSDGSIVVETRVIQKRSRPNATGRVTFGIGFERRARSAPSEPQAETSENHTQVVSQPAPGQSREASVPADPR